ncbi:hypothetical protein CEXT_524681, partial [Caerostris extrusa]
ESLGGVDAEVERCAKQAVVTARNRAGSTQGEGSERGGGKGVKKEVTVRIVWQVPG